jgi:hypothetical protein
MQPLKAETRRLELPAAIGVAESHFTGLSPEGGVRQNTPHPQIGANDE